MGWFLRKSVSVGPFRFNLSGSGVGMSVGVKGFRVGAGPRGNYVHLGRGGIYYRHTFSSSEPQARYAAPMLPISGTHEPLRELESAGVANIVDSSSEELLEEIRAKRRKLSLRPFAVYLSILLLVTALVAGTPMWMLGLLALVCAIGIAAAARRDRIAKTVVILYDFEPHVEAAFRRFIEWAQALAGSARTWHVAASGQVYDRKYHAGASALVQRNVTTVRTAEPPFIRTNVPVLSIGAGRQTLYFLPDRLLVYDSSGVGAITYRSLEISASRQRFIESGGVPSDATVVDTTWQYVNKSGGPDRRFSVNPQIPICLYDELVLRTASGLHEVVQVSRSGIGDGFVAAVRHLGSVV
ncbi:MAG TPA: DUF4236 domain-containing protein [Thermoanaerobaculia bacterium]